MTRAVGDQILDAARRLSEAGIDSPLLDTQLIMARALGCSRLDVIAHSERMLADSQLSLFTFMLEKRLARCPLPYILGRKEFYGLELTVGTGVLIPRPETETLVEECVRRVGQRACLLADIGTGSGAIAVALAASLPESRVYATEISQPAAEVARANVEKHSLAQRVSVLMGDLLEPLVGLGLLFDAIVSNPPYIPTDEIATLAPEIRLYEPAGALDGGPDGLDSYRRLFPESVGLLREGGFVAVEIGAGQADAVRSIASAAGFSKIEVVPDLAGIGRVVIAYT